MEFFSVLLTFFVFIFTSPQLMNVCADSQVEALAANTTNTTRPFGLDVCVSLTSAPFLQRDYSFLGIETVNYTAGLLADDAKRMVINGSRHVTTTELPFTPAQIVADGMMQFPLFAAALVFPFHVPVGALPEGVSIHTGAKLKRDTFVRIYVGKIQFWDDPAMRYLFSFENGTVAANAILPHQRIIVHVRANTAGPNRWVQIALNKFDNQMFNTTPSSSSAVFAKYNPLGVNTSAADDASLALNVVNTPWSIGHCMLASALKNGLNIFALQNANGDFVMPTAPVMADTMDAVVLDNTLYADTIDMPGQNVYPVYVTPYAIITNSSMPCDLAAQFLKIWNWIAFDDAAADALDDLVLFKLGPRFWEASLTKVHSEWKCKNPDGSTQLTSRVLFKLFKSTAVSRASLNDLVVTYAAHSQYSTVAFVEESSGNESSSSLEVVGSAATQCVAFPLGATGIAFTYNTPYSTSSGELLLTQEAIVGIFNGSISTWDHPVLTRTNGFLPLPKDPIALVLRGNEAGQQLASVLYTVLSSWSAEWKKIYGPLLATNTSPLTWFPGVPANRKVICEVTGSGCSLLGSMVGRMHTFGFIGVSLATEKGVKVASVENAESNFVMPTSLSINAAAVGAKIVNESIIPNPPHADAYPAVFVASFRTPLIYAAGASEIPYSKEAAEVAQERAKMARVEIVEEAFEVCPGVIVELEFILWSAFDPEAKGSLLLGEFISLADLDPNWARNLLAVRCAPFGATGAEFYSKAIHVFRVPVVAQGSVGNGINPWILIGLGIAVAACVFGCMVGFMVWSKKQLKMVQELSIAIATFDLESMEWLERKPAKGMIGYYKQILMNMKVYKQYLPSSLTERHATEDEEEKAALVTAKGRNVSLPEVQTGSSIQGGRTGSVTAQQQGPGARRGQRHTESSGSRTGTGTGKAYTMGTQLRRGTFMIINFSGLGITHGGSGSKFPDVPSNLSNDVGTRQQAFNGCFAVINKIVKEKRGIVEDFTYERVVCHWNLHRNVGDYRLLACECAVNLQAELYHHLRAQNMIDVGFDITLTSGDISLSSIGNDTKQRITWISKAWVRAEPMHAFNTISGCSITIDETTKSAVEYSIDCMLVDVVSVHGLNEASMVYELGGTNAMEEGEWMYHNQLRGQCTLGTPDQDSNLISVPAGASGVAGGKKDNHRTQIMLAWSNVVTCLCVRRNRSQAGIQLETFLQRADIPPRLRALAVDMKNFVAQNVVAFPNATSNVSATAPMSPTHATTLQTSNSQALLPTSNSMLQREQFVHSHLPATFQWTTQGPQS